MSRFLLRSTDHLQMFQPLVKRGYHGSRRQLLEQKSSFSSFSSTSGTAVTSSLVFTCSNTHRWSSHIYAVPHHHQFSNNPISCCHKSEWARKLFKFPVFHSNTNISLNGAGSSFEQEEEMELLKQEFQLAFVYAGASTNAGIQSNTVTKDDLSTVLKEFSLATDNEELAKFLQAGTEMTADTIDTSTTSPTYTSDGERHTSDGERHTSDGERHTSEGATSQTHTAHEGHDLVNFDSFQNLLTIDNIKVLKPKSLKLKHGAGFDDGEQLRGKKFNEIPIKDHLTMLYRRMSHEAMHYGRGIKLFMQQFREALKVLSKEFYKIIWAEKDNKVSNSERRLVMTTATDLAKLIPPLIVSCLPGGTVVLMMQSRLLPRTLPSTFQNAPRWEKYHAIKALQRDILRKFVKDKLHEKDAQQRWIHFLVKSNESRLKSRLDPLGVFGLTLRECMQNEIDVLQPRAAYERMTSQHLNVVCESMGIDRFKLGALAHKYVPLPSSWAERFLNTFYDTFPLLHRRSKLARFQNRVATLRFNDRQLAERPGSIFALSVDELLRLCSERGIQVLPDGRSYRMIEYPSTSSSPSPSTSSSPSPSTSLDVNVDATKLMRTWLTQWVALSTMHGFDPAFLALWSLDLNMPPPPVKRPIIHNLD